MITIQITCSTCGKQWRDEGGENIQIDSLNAADHEYISGIISATGWELQENGDNTDTYCSQRCAQ